MAAPLKTAELLDAYLAALRSGRRGECARLTADHPELAEMLGCLERLDGAARRARESDGQEQDLSPEEESALTAVLGAVASAGDAVPTVAMPAPGEDRSSRTSSRGEGSVADAGELRDREAGIEPSLSATPMPFEFGEYELLEEIGRGGMGVVFKARQRDLDRVVAVKTILAGRLAGQEHVRRFLAEARAAARIRHPGVVQVHEVGQTLGHHFFAMEYIDGESLADRTARVPGGVEVDEAVRLIREVARAVHHLHQHGIVHRDLKPSNILIDAQGQARVSDFGLARAAADEDAPATTTGVIAGTPSYMSPEQAAGRRDEVGPASDIYSLGAVLYELLTGRPPFREETPMDTVLMVISRDPPLPRRLRPGIPCALERIVLKCLAKQPSARYPSAAALADDLERFARGEPLAARPPGLLERVAAWSRREPALASRLGGLGAFYAIETVNYTLGGVDWAFHKQISLVLAVWLIASLGCRRWLNTAGGALPGRFAWGTLDVVLLTAVLLIADGAASSLLVAYPLLLVASGLWFQRRFVWFMTALLLASYGLLVVDFYWWRPTLSEVADIRPDRHVIFAAALLILGLLTDHLVARVRHLSKFCRGQLP